MEERISGIKTSEMWDQLFKAPSIQTFIGKNTSEIGLTAFSTYISDICTNKGEVPDRVIRRANVERSFGHQIFRGTRNPSRDTVLQLAFGIGADVPMAQSLLKHAGHSALYPRIERDLAIGYCLYHQMSLVKAQSVLEELGLTLIGSAPAR
jgi:hypothetical protein